MNSKVFFNLKEQLVDSAVYLNQISLEPLQQFLEEFFEDIRVQIVIEDNASVYKKVCIPAKIELRMMFLSDLLILLI